MQSEDQVLSTWEEKILKIPIGRWTELFQENDEKGNEIWESWGVNTWEIWKVSGTTTLFY